MIHIALVSAFPTEAAARASFDYVVTEQYRGIWRVQMPYCGIVHLFSDVETSWLVNKGWEQQ